jgi:hypothetical protein
MLMGIKARKILGPIRGLPVADTDKLASMLMTLGRIGLEIPAIREIDLNPVILAGEKPIAVDALITLD